MNCKGLVVCSCTGCICLTLYRSNLFFLIFVSITAFADEADHILNYLNIFTIVNFSAEQQFATIYIYMCILEANVH